MRYGFDNRDKMKGSKRRLNRGGDYNRDKMKELK